jgi:hypothetical protein
MFLSTATACSRSCIALTAIVQMQTFYCVVPAPAACCCLVAHNMISGMKTCRQKAKRQIIQIYTSLKTDQF